MNRWGCACLLFAALFRATGQPSGIEAPVAGFVVDAQTHSIRPINGLPGSSLLGQPLTLDTQVQTARFSGGGDYALATVKDPPGRLVLIQGLKGRTPYARDLADAIVSVDFISLNDNGSAAICSMASSQLQFVTGLPGAPVFSAPIDLTPVQGLVAGISIGSQGQIALVAASDGSYGGIYEVASQNASVELITRANQPSAATYLNRDRDVVFADPFLNEVILVQDIHGGKLFSVLVGPADHVETPVALQAIDGGVAVANSGSKNIVQYDFSAGRIVADIPLPVVPAALDNLTIRGVFVVNRTGTGPLYLYSSSDSSVRFVPPPIVSALHDAVSGRSGVH
jgi:hypothetical protein